MWNSTSLGYLLLRRMPQGMMISSDVFQEKMFHLFSDFDDIIVYIDNIILYTKSTFVHRVRRISVILSQLQSHKLHVHVEDTYLASKKVNHLEYTLTPEGIHSQTQKVMPILKFAQPKDRRQLRDFLGLVNYYKKLIPRRSHILKPLTRISSDKSNSNGLENKIKRSFTLKKKWQARSY